MSDVTCACCAPVIAEVRARRLPAEPLVEGLGLDLRELENPRQRIRWNDFVVFYRRATALLGADALEELALRSSAQSVPRVIQRLLPRLGDARTLYRMGARWWGPWVFRGTRATCEEIGDGRLREVIEILPGYDECPEFFPGIRGVLRAMPLLFGQPEAVVELVKWDKRRGEFLITPPPARRRLRRSRLRRTEAIPEELEEMGFGQEQLRDSQRRTRAASALLAGRSRQFGALTRIGQELARNQPGRDQAQTMVRLLQEHFRVRAVRVSREEPTDGGPRCVAASGDPLGAPSESHALTVAGRRVGRLELWGLDAAAITWDDAELLRELLPWVGLVLERAWQQEASLPVVEELNDVLTVILGYASLVSDVSEDARTRAELEEIRTASERAAALVSRLLGHRMGSDKPDDAPRRAGEARRG